VYDQISCSNMETKGDQAAQQQYNIPAQQDQQHISTQLPAVRVPGALLAHSSIARSQELVFTLMRSSKQLQTEAAAECAGQLALNVGLSEQQSPSAQAFAAWLRRHAGLLGELHVELFCLESDGSAVLQCLQEQQQQLQALQGLALVSDRAIGYHSLQDGWADPLLPHLPVGLRRLQLTGSRVTVQGDALAVLSRLQQLTQLTIGWPCFSPAPVQLQHMPTTLHSLDLTCSDTWEHQGQDALVPLSRLQQLTELRLGKVQPEQLRQLPPVLQQLDLTLLASEEDHRQAAAWYQQHADIVRRLVLDGGGEVEWKYLKEILQEGWADELAAFPAAAAGKSKFDAVEQAATAAVAAAVATELKHDDTQLPAVRATGTATQQTFPSAATAIDNNNSTSSIGSRQLLQSLQVVRMPWLLDGQALGSLPASSLTELKCSLDSGCERLVASLSSLTALNSLRITYSATKNSHCAALWDLPDSAFAPLSALLQLMQLQLGHVRAQQLAHLQLPRLQQLRAIVARVYPVWQDQNGQPHQLIDVSHLSSLTLLHISSCWM
jgi:hypothetical protein